MSARRPTRTPVEDAPPAPPISRNQRARRAAFAIAAILLGAVVALVVAEIALRIFPPKDKAAAVIGDPSRSVFCQYDAVLGYDGIPNLTAPWPGGAPITLNSAGNRDSEHAFEKGAGVVRAVLVGDSFLWGHGARDGDRAVDRVGDLFVDPSGRGRRLETVNLATSGYGSDQQAMKYVLKGAAYRPDVVVLGFFSGNDPLENASSVAWNCPKPKLVARGGEKLVLTGVPVPRISGWANNGLIAPTSALRRLARTSAVAKFLATREWPLGRLSRDPGGAPDALVASGFVDAVEAEPDESPVDATELTVAIVERLRALLAKADVPLVVLLIPSAHLYVKDYERETRDYQRIRLWAEEKGAVSVDFLAATAEYRGDWEPIYLALNDHWTPKGNEIAARLLAEGIAKAIAGR